MEEVCEIPRCPTDVDQTTIGIGDEGPRGLIMTDERKPACDRTNESGKSAEANATKGETVHRTVNPGTLQGKPRRDAIFLEPTRATVGYNVVMYLGEP